MKLTFVSNYINHHQIPVSSELYKALGDDYTFLQTEPVEQERLQMGWSDAAAELPYVKLYRDDPEKSAALIMNSDVVVFGGSDDEDLILSRIEAGKPVLRYSERIYKTGQWKAISPRGLRKKYHDHIRFRKAPVYLLCAGGYVASDFALIHAYPNKMLKWGYFPETKHYDVDNLLANKYRKTHDHIKLLWAGRFIDWKHPELAIAVARHLKECGVDFRLEMIGGGAMDEELRRMVNTHHLENEVIFAGFLTPPQVRAKMEEADLYLFTSDRQEGWGAVLNEAMNSGCAVIASHAIGAVPYLIQHQHNGLRFRSGNSADLMKQIDRLLEREERIDQLGRVAEETIETTWNAECAAQRLLQLAEALCDGCDPMQIAKRWSDGPGSTARE